MKLFTGLCVKKKEFENIYNFLDKRDVDMYYKVLMEGGHMGAGKSYDMCRYFQANNMAAIFDLLGRMPRLKSKGFSRSVKLIETISEEEFRRGRHKEMGNTYLATH